MWKTSHVSKHYTPLCVMWKTSHVKKHYTPLCVTWKTSHVNKPYKPLFVMWLVLVDGFSINYNVSKNRKSFMINSLFERCSIHSTN